MRAARVIALIVSAMLTLGLPVFAQNENGTALTMIPGWGVQAYASGTPWKELVAEAFHFSPDGSFYEVSDEGFRLKIAVTFLAKKAIEKHKIPIDASCGVGIVLDGTWIGGLGNEHTVIELDFTEGMHTLELRNNCGSDPGNWMALVVGKCLWGTDRRIDFLKAGKPEPQ
jgi:hypothetical protein